MPSSLSPLLVALKMRLAQLGVSVLIALVAGACDESGPRVYTAQAYQADFLCLEAYAPFGLVEANELGASCEPVCLWLGRDLYVSTVCPPYPAEASIEDPVSSTDCLMALSLAEAEASCDADTADAELADAAPADAAPADAAPADAAGPDASVE